MQTCQLGDAVQACRLFKRPQTYLTLIRMTGTASDCHAGTSLPNPVVTDRVWQKHQADMQRKQAGRLRDKLWDNKGKRRGKAAKGGAHVLEVPR